MTVGRIRIYQQNITLIRFINQWGNFGNPRTEEVRVSCDECGYYGAVYLGREYYKSDFD